MSSVVIVDGVSLRYEDLFRAPERDGAVVSVRVHRSVKEVLMRLAEKEGLSGVSELIRYLIAGFLMGKYNLVKPEPKTLAPPVYLNININRTGSERFRERDELRLAVKFEIDEVINEIFEFLENARKGSVKIVGNDYARKLRDKALKAMIKALRYGLEEEYEKLKLLQSGLSRLSTKY
ncbi:MAG: CopG family transcriptional regulator [Thermoprotei archaeon ex4572_64]|nr:MAG: CopG family transcriptional regulator [Thermoprotei archaeon ex4572_64]